MHNLVPDLIDLACLQCVVFLSLFTFCLCSKINIFFALLTLGLKLRLLHYSALLGLAALLMNNSLQITIVGDFRGVARLAEEWLVALQDLRLLIRLGGIA